MYIDNITLKNFRNYSSELAYLGEGLNVVIGKNASGKTNLLESIYCSALGKSPRATKFRELVKWEEDYAYIRIEVVKKFRRHTIEFSIDKMDKKRVAVDGIPLGKIGDLIGFLNVVYFSPDELKLIKESPQERRRFMDISLSQQSKIYFDSLSKYNNILAHRNKLLKEKYTLQAMREMLYVWDQQLIKYASFITQKRYEFIKNIGAYAGEIHSNITQNQEVLQLDYESKCPYATQEEMQRMIASDLVKSLEKDVRLQYTSVGPHRDDIVITVNNIDARKYGSQGQQRTCALSLKLAEIDNFRNEIGETPILLLDDVLSELDINRRGKLMELSTGMQTIITCTDFDMELGQKIIKISHGKIV